MLNKIFKYLAILLILPNLNCAAVTVFDPQNLAKSVEILKAAKSQFEQMKRVHAELSSAKKLLGDFSEDAQNKIAELTNWRNYYDYIDLLDVDQISAANFLGVDGKLPLNNTLDTFNAIQTKLFNNKAEQMEFTRQQLARNAIVSGVVVSETNKKNLGETKKKIKTLTNNAIQASDLLSAIKNQNKLLSIIASELVQSRTIQAQQLELLAAFLSQLEGTGNLTVPKATMKKNIWD
jgi:hypothetical protein